jgi:hypothetical protein
MDRSEWLKKMRTMAKTLYAHGAPAYWVRYGLEPYLTHRQFIEKFLELLREPGTILDAVCGAGLYNGMLLEAGHRVRASTSRAACWPRHGSITRQSAFTACAMKR